MGWSEVEDHAEIWTNKYSWQRESCHSYCNIDGVI